MRISSLIIFLMLFFPVLGFAQVSPEGLEALTITEAANGTKTYSVSLKILALMTALTILPSLVLGMTAFTRIIIVMSILRQALGTQQTPPNQILVAISNSSRYMSQLVRTMVCAERSSIIGNTGCPWYKS